MLPLTCMTKIKSARPKFIIAVIGVIITLSTLFFRSHYNKTLINHQNTEQTIQMPFFTPTIIQSTNTSSPSVYSTYTYKTFSFSYPKTWKMFDTDNNPTFFTKNRLIGFIHGIAVEKEDYLLFIGVMDKPVTEVGGTFITDQEFQNFKKERDELIIQGKPFYLSKRHSPLQVMTDPNTNTGIWGFASLSEYTPNSTIFGHNRIMGYSDIIKEKNGLSYLFIKFKSLADISDSYVTPTHIQKEIAGIIETIRW